jgi:transcriptional regulator CtsR
MEYRMDNASDAIERLIKELLDDNGGQAVIARNELATKLDVFPSQITYVLTTRFTAVHGYTVESRRGGGGGILVRRVLNETPSQYLMHAVNSIGDSLTQAQSTVLIRNFFDYRAIDETVASVMAAAVSCNTLAGLGSAKANKLRAAILKNMAAAAAAVS